MHRHKRYDLDGFARASWLFDENVFCSPADVCDQSNLIGTQFLGSCLHLDVSTCNIEMWTIVQIWTGSNEDGQEILAEGSKGDATRFELYSVQTSYSFPQTSQPIIPKRAGIASEFCCRFAKLSLGSTERDAV